MSEILEGEADYLPVEIKSTPAEQVAASEIDPKINNEILLKLFDKFSDLFTTEAISGGDEKLASFISVASAKIRAIEEKLYKDKKDEFFEDKIVDEIYKIIKDDYPKLYEQLKSIFI